MPKQQQQKIMVDHTQTTKTISLEQYGIKNAKVHYQLSPQELQKITVNKGMGKETNNGTLLSLIHI